MSKLHVRIPLSSAIRQSDVILQQHVGENHLELIRRKEAAGTGVASVAKGQAVLANAHELIEGCALGRAATIAGFLSQLVEPQRIELLWLRKQFWVEADGDSGNLDNDTSRDDLAIAEREGLQYFPLE